MPGQPQLQIYNIIRIPDAKEPTFPSFPSLPTELRLKIWQHAMQRPRFIRIRLYPARQGETEKPRMIIDGQAALSKLLHVSRESREAALGFYRAHIPCEFRVDTDQRKIPIKRGTFYFNPEYDMLRIYSRSPVRDSLLEFLHQLKHTHDPRRVGLLNLALDVNDVKANNLHWSSPDDGRISAEVRRSFTETLTQLREVFFVEVARAGRQVVGPVSGPITSDTFFNRSFPIFSTSTTAFDRLPQDPRAISDDLKRVFVGMFDPRSMFDLWGRLLRRWAVSPSHHVSYRFLLAFMPDGNLDMARDRASAERWLQTEDCIWKGEPFPKEPITALGRSLRQQKPKRPAGANHPKYRDEDLENAVKPAFGFWLFPLEALGAVSPADGDDDPRAGLIQPEGYQLEHNRLLDVTGHWPELALVGL
ncbi:hypothetical protein BO71DRAFT_399805 [Aspergillus ellipticus CBS 707.79]|uniref:2EXR domain-containing protein n=1 Tax=Aspergillus ellipticus CBS 707.79 TaxID=1448320 RepID=A0A319D7Y5_9EURO|nr:hypothetical protein BO71DRAFT_399805 [Aspergillus ellipticus CBS 707.79]